MEAASDYRKKILDYYDDVAPIYGVKHGADMPGGQYSFNVLYKPMIERWLSTDMRVLELGCGNGASTEMLSSLGLEIVATDISQKMLDVASKRHMRNVTFRCLDAMAIDAKELALFDAVVAFNTFSYYPDKTKVLRDFKTVLKPQGRIILLDMNALCPLYPIMARYGKNEMKTWWPTIMEMTPSNLRRMLGQQGYEIDEMKTLNFVPHAVEGWVFETLKRFNPSLNRSFIKRFAMRIYVSGRSV
jgi:ubiquinone/menaquinone biosynthesis C-methylase UbiE